MARHSSGPSFILVLIFLILIGGLGGYVFFFTDILQLSSKQEKIQEAPKPDEEIFSQVDEWVLEVVWEKPKAAEKQVYYGIVDGYERTGKIVNREGYIEHFENIDLLNSLGFSEDLNLSADGPGSSLWGYKKNIGQELQIVTLSYDNEDMHQSSDGPLVADCPCTLNLSVFVSNVFKPNWKETDEENN